jgi:uncharacterized protein YbcI
MHPSTTTRLPNGLPAKLTTALAALWTEYAGRQPTGTRVDVHGNVITCILVGAVRDFERRVIASPVHDNVLAVSTLTAEGYKREAVAAVTLLTRQRVLSFLSSHDPDTDVATETFTLAPSLARGASRAERRFRHATLPPARV